MPLDSQSPHGIGRDDELVSKLLFQRCCNWPRTGRLAVKHLRKIRKVIAQVKHHFVVRQHAVATGLFFAGVGFEENVVSICVGKALLLQVRYGFIQLILIAVGDVKDLRQVCKVEKVHSTWYRLGRLLHAPLLPGFFGEFLVFQICMPLYGLLSKAVSSMSVITARASEVEPACVTRSEAKLKAW